MGQTLKTNLFWYLKKHEAKKFSYKCPETRLLNFYFCCHFQSEITLGTPLGFSFKLADKVADLKLICYHFLKTLNLRQNLHSRVMKYCFKVCITCLFHYFYRTAIVQKFHFSPKQGLGWNSIVELGPEDICLLLIHNCKRQCYKKNPRKSDVNSKQRYEKKSKENKTSTVNNVIKKSKENKTSTVNNVMKKNPKKKRRQQKTTLWKKNKRKKDVNSKKRYTKNPKKIRRQQ